VSLLKTIRRYFSFREENQLSGIWKKFFQEEKSFSLDCESALYGIFRGLVSMKDMDHPILSLFNDEIEKRRSGSKKNPYHLEYEEIWSGIFRVVFTEKLKHKTSSSERVVNDLVEWVVDRFRLCLRFTIFELCQRIKDPAQWVDFSMLSFLDPYLPCDIIFLDISSEKSYFDTKDFGRSDSRDVVLLLYHPEVHYENLGRYYGTEQGGGGLSRIFSKDDPLIEFLRRK
ncbi:hypothetical protein EBS02_11555, partial [bacterium]|nr:hypothetical protein [bacterium]